MSCLTIQSQLEKSFDFFAKRREEMNLRKYCQERGLCDQQIAVCRTQYELHGLREAQMTADRISASMRAIRTRLDTQPDPPCAA